MIPRAVLHIFNGMEARRESAREKGELAPMFEVTAQFMEVCVLVAKPGEVSLVYVYMYNIIANLLLLWRVELNIDHMYSTLNSLGEYLYHINCSKSHLAI